MVNPETPGQAKEPPTPKIPSPGRVKRDTAPRRPGRSKAQPLPNEEPPGRAILEPTPTATAPGRANPSATPIPEPPGRAMDHSGTIDGAPGRAKVVAAPNEPPPGRANQGSEPIEGSPGRADGFDVHALAQQVIADREPPWALQDLVEDMLAATPAESMRVAYAMALRPLMRQELAQVNSRPDQVAVDAQGQTVGAGGTADQGGSDTQTTPVGGAVPNHERSRVALFRASGFRSVVHVGTGRWQYLLDCTAEQLLYAAAENRRIAVANNRTADRYEQLVEQMRRLGVSTPRGLPYDVLKRTYNAA